MLRSNPGSYGGNLALRRGANEVKGRWGETETLGRQRAADSWPLKKRHVSVSPVLPFSWLVEQMGSS